MYLGTHRGQEASDPLETSWCGCWELTSGSLVSTMCFSPLSRLSSSFAQGFVSSVLITHLLPCLEYSKDAAITLCKRTVIAGCWGRAWPKGAGVFPSNRRKATGWWGVIPAPQSLLLTSWTRARPAVIAIMLTRL